MKTNTEIRTEYAGMGRKADGTWKKITPARNPAEAQKELQEYMSEVERYPDLFTKYEEYKVAKRTVITTYSEWETV